MISLKKFMEIVDYRITEGYEYQWTCYGPDAFALDSWNHQQDGYSAGVMFDTKTHTVYEVSICDYKRGRAYRMINPDFRAAHREEAKSKNVLENQAWDDVDYVDLEVEEDFVSKASAIISDTDYDNKVSVPLDLDDDELFMMMKLAHEQDITLNQLVEKILIEAIKQHEFYKEWAGQDLVPADIEEPVAQQKKKKKKR